MVRTQPLTASRATHRPTRRKVSCLVALTAFGALSASEATVASAAPPVVGAHSISIAANHTTVTWGNPVLLSGTFSGSETANQKVTLEANSFPFTAGFSRVGNVNTDAAGKYTFNPMPQLATKYRVTGKAPHSQATHSPEVLVKVRYKIALHVSDRTPKAGQVVRFSGLVYPPHDGRKISVQRKTSTGAWKTLSRATLVASNGTPPASAYSASLKVRRTGRYRVLVRSDADHVSNHTSSRLLRVHR